MENEKYYLQNTDTKFYLKGFTHVENIRTPVWTENKNNATYYTELDALRCQRQLNKQHQNAVLIEK